MATLKIYFSVWLLVGKFAEYGRFLILLGRFGVGSTNIFPFQIGFQGHGRIATHIFRRK